MNIQTTTTQEQDAKIARYRNYLNKQPLATPQTSKEIVTSKLNEAVEQLVKEAENVCDGLQILQLIKSATPTQKQQILQILNGV